MLAAQNPVGMGIPSANAIPYMAEPPTGTTGSKPVERSPATTEEQDAALQKQLQQHVDAQKAVGKDQQHDSELTFGDTVQTVKQNIPDDVDLDKLMDMRKKFMAQPQNVKAQAQIDSQAQFLQKYMSKPIGFDFKTAMGGLASFYPESSAANLYKILPDHDTAEARVKTISTLQNSLNNARSKYFTNVEEQMKGALSGSTIRSTAVDNLKNKFGAVPSNTFGLNSILNREDRQADKFERSWKSGAKMYTESFDALQGLLNMPAGSPLNAATAQYAIAKGIQNQTGVLTGQDYATAEPDPRIASKIRAFMKKKFGEGDTLTDTNKEIIMDFARKAYKNRLIQLEAMNKSEVGAFKKLYGRDFSEAGEEFSGQYKNFKVAKPESTEGAGPPTLTESMNAAAAAMKAEKAAEAAKAAKGK